MFVATQPFASTSWSFAMQGQKCLRNIRQDRIDVKEREEYFKTRQREADAALIPRTANPAAPLPVAKPVATLPMPACSRSSSPRNPRIY
jgi:hypothetical protein